MNRYDLATIIPFMVFIIVFVAFIIYVTMLKNKSKLTLPKCAPNESINWQTMKCQPIDREPWRRSEQSLIDSRHPGSYKADDYGAKWNPNSSWGVSPDELERIRQYSSQMFNNLPPNIPPPT